MTRVKICGITRPEDAQAAIALGAHALGFIFVPSSPRYVGEGDAAERILETLPPFVETVFVCRSLEDYRAHPVGRLFSAVQVYELPDGSEVAPGVRLIAAIRVPNQPYLDLPSRRLDRARAVLLDAYHPGALGGTGQTFDWRHAQEAKKQLALPLILAGGLTPENVGDAVRAVRPFAVDVSSGVEAAPGQKDIRRMEAFFEAVRRADADDG